MDAAWLWIALAGIVGYALGKSGGYVRGQYDERERIKKRWQVKVRTLRFKPEDFITEPGGRIPPGMEALFESQAKKASAKARRRFVADEDGDWMDEEA